MRSVGTPCQPGYTDRSAGAVPVHVNALRSGFSPRLEGENPDHIRFLSDAKGPMPPILVHRASMRVIDGMHRLQAAIRRGADTVLVEFFNGSEDDAHLLAVKRNTRHGFPLTPADRTAAVRRILDVHPEWSDRAIAEATGISAKTIRPIRRRLSGENGATLPRLGRDGRIRPLDAVEGRLRASQLMKHEPTASLREIAGKAGISLSTAQDVRQRLRTGQDPVPSRHHQASEPALPSHRTELAIGQTSSVDRAALVTTLKKDPSLRFSEAGRLLLRLLDAHTGFPTDRREQLTVTIPEHWLGAIADLADEYATFWHALSRQLRHREAPRA